MERQFRNSYIKIEFSYNGDLGRLQHQTKANLLFTERLYDLGVIDYAACLDIKEQVIEYFKLQIASVEADPGYYLIQ